MIFQNQNQKPTMQYINYSNGLPETGGTQPTDADIASIKTGMS